MLNLQNLPLLEGELVGLHEVLGRVIGEAKVFRQANGPNADQLTEAAIEQKMLKIAPLAGEFRKRVARVSAVFDAEDPIVYAEGQPDPLPTRAPLDITFTWEGE